MPGLVWWERGPLLRRQNSTGANLVNFFSLLVLYPRAVTHVWCMLVLDASHDACRFCWVPVPVIYGCMIEHVTNNQGFKILEKSPPVDQVVSKSPR